MIKLSFNKGFFKRFFEKFSFGRSFEGQSPLSLKIRQRATSMALGLLVLSTVGGATWFGFTKYTAHQERQAQLAFSHCSKQFDIARSSGLESDWQDLQVSADAGYKKYQRTHLAPYFLLLETQAQTLRAEKDLLGAVQTMDRLIAREAKNSPLLGLLRLRKALIQIDLDESDKIVQASSQVSGNGLTGISELESLAYDATNNEQDAALFYLGQYYWSHDELEKAQVAWQKLASGYSSGDDSGVWARAASQQLAHLPPLNLSEVNSGLGQS